MNRQNLLRKGAVLGFVAVLATSIIGCGEGLSRYENRAVKKAPVSDNDVGIVVVDASPSSIEEFLEANPDVTFRALRVDETSAMVEFFGVNEENVKKAFNNIESFKNIILKDEPKLNTNWIAKAMTLNVPEIRVPQKIQKIANANAGETEEALDPRTCKKPKIAGPNAVMTSNRNKETLLRDYVKPSQNLKFMSVGSTPSPGLSKLKAAWLFLPPEGSSHQPNVYAQSTIEFKPDMVGLYTVALIVQDEEGFCASTGEEILVADNPELSKVINKFEFKGNLADFPHGFDLNLNQTRKVSTGKDVVIAVIDSGVNYNHPGLRENMLVNSADPVNGKDDDGNGIIDDYLGYDFAHGDRFPYDDVGHGTMVAGLAASKWIGVAPDAKILAIKSSHKHGSDMATLVASVKYAIDRNVDIINLSMGSHARPPAALVKEVVRAEKLGIIIVASSGNGDAVGKGIDTDLFPHYPSSLPNTNIISVAARDHVGLIADYSNYGKVSVDIVTVGGTQMFPVKSLYVPNPVGQTFVDTVGTSFSAPVVSGIVATLLQIVPEAKPELIKQILLQSGRKEEALKDKVASGRVLSLEDSLKAVQLLDLFM